MMNLFLLAVAAALLLAAAFIHRVLKNHSKMSKEQTFSDSVTDRTAHESGPYFSYGMALDSDGINVRSTRKRTALFYERLL